VKIEVKTPGNTSLAKDEKRPDELLPMPADPPAVSEAEYASPSLTFYPSVLVFKFLLISLSGPSQRS